MRTLSRWIQHVESRHMRYWDILPAWYQDRMGWYDLRVKPRTDTASSLIRRRSSGMFLRV